MTDYERGQALGTGIMTMIGVIALLVIWFNRIGRR
jgi:hypothetical protein